MMLYGSMSNDGANVHSQVGCLIEEAKSIMT